MKKLLLFAVAALTLIATPAVAKEGFFVGAYLIQNAKMNGDAGAALDTGSGYGFRAGLGFNRYFSIEGNYEKTSFDVAGAGTADLSGLAADLKLNFPLTSLDSGNVMTLEPYIKFGYGFDYDLKPSYGGSSTANGARLGVGLELYLFRELSANIGWTRTNLSFGSPLNKDGDLRAFDIGLIYHFL